MHSKTTKLFLLPFIFLLIISCTSKHSQQNNRIVIGIADDVQTFNTLFVFSVNEGAITDLFYPSLVDFKWNDENGDIDAYPMIAESWNWSDDSSSIKFNLRKDVLWSDGEKLTTEDIVFSFDVFSDPKVQSRLFGTFDQFFCDADNHIDIQKTFKIISPFEIEVSFPKTSVPDLIEFALPVIPKHFYGNVEREKLSESEKNFSPVSSGAFKLKKWEKNQYITLEADSNSFLFRDGQVAELSFKVIPDYTSRILQLKKGEIDFLEKIKVEDIDELKNEDQLVVVPVTGREYDYIGWNNIDPAELSKGRIKSNKFFGSSNIRKALSMAINRKEILEEYLMGVGELSSSPVSSVFKSVFNKEVKPYDYNPAEAKRLLALEGWNDVDGDGILEKGNAEFKFTLYYPVGNPLREYASTVIKNNLKSVGIDVTTEKMELGTFIDELYQKKLSSWMAAWYIPVPLELKAYWYSDPNVTPLNFISYKNPEVDKILDKLETRINAEEKIHLIKNFQRIIHEEEPVTFLYWTPNITIHNKRIKNLSINPFTVVGRCWEWTIEQ
jgi:peptide/nickel transport system substrate-binding protein